MTVPTATTYAVATLDAMNDVLLVDIDAGTGAAQLNVYDSGDVLLAEIVFDDPAGTVSGTTGVLTLAIAGPDTSLPAAGTAAYGVIVDSDDTEIVRFPVKEGTAAESGYLVINSLSLLQGSQLTLNSGVVG